MATHYQLWTFDERDNNWIAMQDNLYGVPSIFQSYIPYFCLACRQLDKKAVFFRKEDLEAGPQIRVKTGREFAHSTEGFKLVKTRILELLKQHGVAGYDSRPIPHTDWHVMRITKEVPFKEFTPNYEKAACKICGYRAYYGVAQALSEISMPDEENAFFTPDLERPQGQDVYLTEQVALMLKANGAKGATLSRLLDNQEYKLLCENTPEAARKIKNRHIYL
jgi:hypothetical protein